jgi:hypothetical protein
VRRAVALLLFFHPAKSDRMQQERTMTTAKQVRELFPKERLRQRYGGRKPKSYRLAHNHVMHTNNTQHGDRGFRRFWIPPQWIADGSWAKCPCGWHNGDTHYAWKEHVAHWKRQIKKFGSLEGAYADVWKRLAKEYPRMKNLPGHVA